MSSAFRFVIVLVAFACAEALAEPIRYEVDRENSVVAFVTFKAGFLAGLTENIVTTPDEYDIDLEVSEDLADSRFAIRIDATSLDIHDPDIVERWYEAMAGAGVLDEPPGKMGRFKRRRIEDNMTGEDMLDIETHPEITAHTLAIVPLDHPTLRPTHRIRLNVTIRGETLTAEWPAFIRRTDGQIELETFGSLKLTDFGMEPYASVFGAIRYEDEITVFAHIEATATAQKQP